MAGFKVITEEARPLSETRLLPPSPAEENSGAWLLSRNVPFIREGNEVCNSAVIIDTSRRACVPGFSFSLGKDSMAPFSRGHGQIRDGLCSVRMGEQAGSTFGRE